MEEGKKRGAKRKGEFGKWETILKQREIKKREKKKKKASLLIEV